MQKKILYLGLDPSRYPADGEIFHCPIIAIKPLPLPTDFNLELQRARRLLFTSQTAVKLMPDLPHEMEIVCIGKATADLVLQRFGIISLVAKEETGEGILALLENLPALHLIYPHSKATRPLILDFLKEKELSHFAFPLYEPTINIPKNLPSLEDFDEIVFTSPSTVDAFFSLYKKVDPRVKLSTIGPITKNYLNIFLASAANS